MTDVSKQLIILVRDLMFSSKITAAARDANIPFRVVRDLSVLPSIPGAALIVDLNQEGFLEAAASWRDERSLQVIGFVAHVDTEIIDRAKTAGLDRVLTRGQFSSTIDRLLTDPSLGLRD